MDCKKSPASSNSLKVKNSCPVHLAMPSAMRPNSIYNHDHKYKISRNAMPQKMKQLEYSNRFAKQQG